MSGKDEQPIRDVPTCPLCGCRPGFWILYSTDELSGENGWFWLFSNAYISKHGRPEKAERHHGDASRYPYLDDVELVVCGVITTQHHFRRGDPTFHGVIKQIRRLENKW